MAKDSPYQKYVWDFENRKMVGKFEEMYKAEDDHGFDSWYSSNLNHFPKQIHYTTLKRYNFSSILDFGCGKGAFTHILKKENNYVLGLDISETAIKKARSYYGDHIDFDVITDNNFEPIIKDRKFDLTIILEVLSLIENWRNVIADISKFSNYIYIASFMPNNPIGFIKTKDSLVEEVNKYFKIEKKIILTENNEDSIFIFAKNLNMEV